MFPQLTQDKHLEHLNWRLRFLERLLGAHRKPSPWTVKDHHWQMQETSYLERIEETKRALEQFEQAA